IARLMPVLPLVGSSTVHPGVSSPSFSACSTIANAGRSFTGPVGLRSSSLAQSRTGFGPSHCGESRGRPTSGVRPSESSSESKRAIVEIRRARGLAGSPGDRGKDRDDVAVGDGRLDPAEETDVLVVEIDVDEAVDRSVADQPVAQPLVAGI